MSNGDLEGHILYTVIINNKIMNSRLKLLTNNDGHSSKIESHTNNTKVFNISLGHFKPRREKTCLRGFRQVRLKPTCSATEAS